MEGDGCALRCPQPSTEGDLLTLFTVLHVTWLFNQPAAGPRYSLKTLLLSVSRRAVGGEQSVKCPPVPRLHAPRSRGQDVLSVAVTAQVMSVDERRPRGHRKTHQASRTCRDWHLWTHVTSEGNGVFLMLAYGFTREMGYSENPGRHLGSMSCTSGQMLPSLEQQVTQLLLTTFEEV